MRILFILRVILIVINIPMKCFFLIVLHLHSTKMKKMKKKKNHHPNEGVIRLSHT